MERGKGGACMCVCGRVGADSCCGWGRTAVAYLRAPALVPRDVYNPQPSTPPMFHTFTHPVEEVDRVVDCAVLQLEAASVLQRQVHDLRTNEAVWRC
eukprot:361502-Chlamydomonas_euryale.AAC.1